MVTAAYSTMVSRLLQKLMKPLLFLLPEGVRLRELRLYTMLLELCQLRLKFELEVLLGRPREQFFSKRTDVGLE